MSRSPGITACVFDAYGTLLDLESAVEPHRAALGGSAAGFLKLWRGKQLEYTWLRTLMGRYADFAQVTADALDYACDSFGVRDPALRAGLLGGFERLQAFGDAGETLARLRTAGIRTAVLSNGTPAMLTAAFEASGLAPHLDRVLSVEAVSKYKPAAEVYALAASELAAGAGELLFVSANAWDISGAASAGLVTAWINRAAAPRERLPFGATHVVGSLSEIPALAGRSSGFAE
ncbi:MAG TPA: haloacid dehalogenase type II [Gemmatimonadales bacterium]|nr:haloacid dehalogenase type II [Gemmatimonadales bacterium]